MATVGIDSSLVASGAVVNSSGRIHTSLIATAAVIAAAIIIHSALISTAMIIKATVIDTSFVTAAIVVITTVMMVVTIVAGFSANTRMAKASVQRQIEKSFAYSPLGCFEQVTPIQLFLHDEKSRKTFQSFGLIKEEKEI